MVRQTETKLYLICDICGIEELPDFELRKKISVGKVDESELPNHCSQAMRLTILEKPVDELEYKINSETVVWSIIETIKYYLFQQTGSNELGNQFEKEFQVLMEDFETDLLELMILKLKEMFELAITKTIENISYQVAIRSIYENIIEKNIENVKKRASGGNKSTTPVLPGSLSTHSLEFVCTVCNTSIEIDPKIKQQILETDEEIELPTHHGEALQIKITQTNDPIPSERKPTSTQNAFFESSNVEELQITSVGIDIGSSTSHLIFSKLDLRREVGFMNITNRFNIINRNIIYESEIIDTPLLNKTTIDVDKVIEFCKNEYKKAGLTPEDIDTGAVIITGETAKKENAAEIVERLSDEAGKFVSATAGPNLESMLAAMGSGAVARSEELQNVILNVDVGGGTSNLAIIKNGKVVDTSCINVGGRLLGFDDDFKIWRIDQPTETVMEQLDLSYLVGDTISEDDVKKIATVFSSALIEVMQGPAKSEISKKLMITDDMNFEIYEIEEIIFSGGVAEMIYNENLRHRDIGTYIAQEIKHYPFSAEIIETPNKIRATVIGAGSYSLTISGSTILYDKNINFPLTNIPVLVINASKENFSKTNVKEEISKAFKKYDIQEGKELVALYFDDPIYARDMFLPEFVTAIEEALPNAVTKNELIILVFRTDVGGTIGMSLRKETQITENFLCIDEIELHEGDWIDIGTPMHSGDVFPVTVKSLVFN